MLQLPTEFRVFQQGWNSTRKGFFLFDDKAAELTMAAYRQRGGVKVQIDLEHLSIDQESNAYDPDARGWCDLEVRDGELWAVNVTWTDDGAKRLHERRQRYISPFFGFEAESRRVECIINIAMTANPATDSTPALVAASSAKVRHGLRLATLSIEVKEMDIKQLISLLGLSEDATAEDIVAAIKALQEKGGGGEGGELLARMCKALGLSDDAKEEEVMKKLAALSEDDGDKEEQKGELAALRNNVKQLSERLSRQETRSEKDEVEKLIEENTDKISLELEPWAREQSPKSLKAFLKHAISQPRERKEEPKREGSDDTGEVKLTKEERQIAKLSGLTADKALENKKALVQRARDAKEMQ